MEFDIDHALVDGIIADETQQTQADLATAGPVLALARSQARHEARLAAAADAPTLACKAGCYWCCYFTVEVRPVEAVRIVDYMQRELGHADRERILGEIHTNAAALSVLDDRAQLHHNLKCPFLRFGRCSIYPVRPQTCRNYHATNNAGCEQAFKEPENDDIDPEFAPLVYQSGGAHVDAFSAAFQRNGIDVAAYELNAAIAAAWADPAAARTRLEAGACVFPTVEGIDVIPEFIDE